MQNKKYDEVLEQIEEFLEDEELQQDNAFLKNMHQNFLALHSSEQADIISDLKFKKRAVFINFILKDLDPEILIHFEKPVLQDFAETVKEENFGKMVSALSINYAVDVLEEFEKEYQKEILEFVQYKKRVQIKRLLSYPEESAGRNMSLDFFSIPNTFTAKETMDYIHKNIKGNNKDVKNIEIFVTNGLGEVAGIVSIFSIINLKPLEKITSIVQPVKHIFNTYDEISEVIESFIEYHLQIVPIIDVNLNLVGVIEINNIANLIKEDAEKNMFMRAGVFEAKREGIFSLMKARFTWLFINFFTASTAASLISMFEPLVASFAVLAVLTPIVASIGGNTGNQASAVIIRSLATREFEAKIVLREIAVSLMNSISFATIAFVISYAIYTNFLLSLSFGLAIFINLNMGGIAGSFVPLIISKLKIDPALGSSILLTMVTDMVGFFSFLGIAYLVMGL